MKHLEYEGVNISEFTRTTEEVRDNKVDRKRRSRPQLLGEEHNRSIDDTIANNVDMTSRQLHSALLLARSHSYSCERTHTLEGHERAHGHSHSSDSRVTSERVLSCIRSVLYIHVHAINLNKVRKTWFIVSSKWTIQNQNNVALETNKSSLNFENRVNSTKKNAKMLWNSKGILIIL